MRSLPRVIGALAFGSLLLAPTARAAYPDCPPATPSPSVINDWRAGAVAALGAGFDFNSSVNPVGAIIDKCFPSKVPACLVRTYSYATRNDVADSWSDTAIDITPQKQPPKELLAPNAQGLQYFVPQNLEAIAQSKGWLTARYKSRHSGGFDSQTSSLLMVYVPGDKVSPPVTYDRWLNFALPADVDPDTLNPVPQKQFPSATDYANENSSGNYYPSTFTMIALERATNASPSHVYFQKFDRTGQGNGIWTPEDQPDLQGCVSCHPNGMRWISPLGFHVRQGETQLPTNIWNSVLAINTAMDDSAASKLTDWRMGTKTIYTSVPAPAAAQPSSSTVTNPVASSTASGGAASTYPLCPSSVSLSGGFGWVTVQSLCQQSTTTQSQFSQSGGCSCSSTPPAVVSPPVAAAGSTYPVCPASASVSGGWGWTNDQGQCQQSATSAAQYSQSGGCSCSGSGVQPPATVEVTSTVKLPLIRPGSYWPIIGALKPLNKVSRTQAFIMGGTLPDGTQAAGCYKTRTHIDVTDIFGRPPGAKNVYDMGSPPQINWLHVRNAMYCEGCHNNRNRYTINDQTDRGTIDFKILVDQSMPQGAHQDPLEQASATASVVDTLTQDERMALVNCLIAELDLERPLANAWMTTPICQ